MMEDPTSENCLICFESLTDCPETGSTVEKTECEHVFHSHCLSEWFRIGVPGNYCPFCRSAIPGMEAVTSEAEADESEQSFSDSDSEEQLDQMSEEDFQPYLQTFLETEEELIQRQDTLTNIGTGFVGIQELLSRFIPTTSSEQQEKFDLIHEILSLAHECIHHTQEILEKAREMLSRVSQPLDRSTLIERMSDLKDMQDSLEQNANNLLEMSERLFSMNILQNLMNCAND